MRLSDAIAMGRTLVSEPRACDLEKCALGMAGKATGLDMAFGQYIALQEKWPWLKEAAPRCCNLQDPAGNRAFLGAVWHRFDWHVMHEEDMTLDQLIDFVRSVEPAEAEPSLPCAIAAIEESSMGVKSSS